MEKKEKLSSTRRSLLGKKALSFGIVLASALATASAIFVATGEPSFSLRTFFITLIIYIAESLLLTKLAPRFKNAGGYLLDVIYGIFTGFTFLTFAELEAGGYLYRFLNFLCIFIFAIFFTTYLEARHPKPVENIELEEPAEAN